MIFPQNGKSSNGGNPYKPSLKQRRPKQKRGVQTRNQIIAAAESLFSEKGYYRTNSKEIAARAGVAVGTFYAYFKDKKAVFLKVLDRYNQRVIKKVSARPGNQTSWKSPRDLLNHLLQNALKAHDFSPRFHREATAMRYSDPDVEAYFQWKETKIAEHMTGLFETFGPQIRAEDPQAAALVIHQAIEGVVHSIKIFGGRLPEKRVMKALTEMISRYLFQN